MKRAAIYIRVSTQEQASEGYSISAQKDKLISYCKAKNWNIFHVYTDGGYSGSNLDRPALQKMLNELDNIDIVLVYKLDRLSRSQKDTLFLIEDKFLSNNVDFVSLSESFDTSTPFGKAIIGILSVFAQLERETIKERAKLGKEKRTQEGLWRGGGNVPTGYNYCEDTGELNVNQYEAMQIKEIFRLYNEGKGYSEIAKILNNKGYRKENGVKWYINAVKRVLTNPIYKGYLEYKGKLYPGLHEPIISEELFDKTQRLLQKKKSKRYTKSNYLLTGILWCGYCGARMKGTWITRYKNGPKYYYYLCYSKAGSPIYMVKNPKCPSKHIPMEKIDQHVVNELKKIKLDKNRIIEEYHKDLENKSPQINIKSINNKLKVIDRQINKLIDLYQYEHIPHEELSKRIQSLQQNKKELQQTLQNYCKTKDSFHIDLKAVIKYIDKFELIWKEATKEEKRNIIRCFIEKIEVKKNNIYIKWNV